MCAPCLLGSDDPAGLSGTDLRNRWRIFLDDELMAHQRISPRRFVLL
jgi:hypothetical protein